MIYLIQAVSCQAVEHNKGNFKVMDDYTYEITSNTQIFVDNLAIGAAGAREIKDETEDGAQKEVIGLWIHDKLVLENNSAFFLVSAGDQFEIGGHEITVIEINAEDRGSVTLEIRASGKDISPETSNDSQ